MAGKEYEIEVRVLHIIYVIANSREEAEELAYDTFMDEEDMWDDVDYDFLSETEV